MAETREQLEALLADLRGIRATGVRKSEYNNSSVEYRSDAEIAAAIADLERRLGAQGGAPLRMTYLTSSKGA